MSGTCDGCRKLEWSKADTYKVEEAERIARNARNECDALRREKGYLEERVRELEVKVEDLLNRITTLEEKDAKEKS